MRCANKWPSLVEFHRFSDTLPIWNTVTNDQIVSWNTERIQITQKKTTPMPRVTISPDEWSKLARASIETESWLVDAGEETQEEECWLC